MHRFPIVSMFLVACGAPGDPNGSATSSTSTGSSSTGSSVTGSSGSADVLGEEHTGNFWLGPVDYAETQWHNACAPSNKYPAGIQALYGNYIMGFANEVTFQGLTASAGQLCDVCVQLEANGKSLIARAVTYGQETGPNDIDVSPEIDAELNGDSGRTATWKLVACPTTDPLHYTFDGRQWDNVWFFRVWVRNARMPVANVEYRIGDAEWATADWQSDGAWQASSQDFSGGFSLRVTSIDDQVVEDELPGLNTFDPDVGVEGGGNFE